MVVSNRHDIREGKVGQPARTIPQEVVGRVGVGANDSNGLAGCKREDPWVVLEECHTL